MDSIKELMAELDNEELKKEIKKIQNSKEEGMELYDLFWMALIMGFAVILDPIALTVWTTVKGLFS